MPRSLMRLAVPATAAALFLAACSAPQPSATRSITAETFGCMRDMTPVGRFFVGNLDGDLEATLAVARSAEGGVFPTGSVIQLVPTEVMIKREPGFNAQTRDWEFFELDVSPAGSVIRTRGHADVVNRFGGNCLECHAKADAKFDMICSTDHGCDPIPLTEDMISALQKTDPRCPPAALNAAEQEALAFILESAAPAPTEAH